MPFRPLTHACTPTSARIPYAWHQMPVASSRHLDITTSVSSLLSLGTLITLNGEATMPTWTKSPPEDPRGHGLPLIRTPAAGCLRAIVTSQSLIGTDTHFWGGHTIPCERPDCEACNHGIGYQWHGYITAINPSTDLHFIFEMTAQAAIPFNEFQEKNGSLRTAQFQAYRWNRRKNGRVIIKVEQSATPSHALPSPPDLIQIMAIIWRLPPQNVKQDGLSSVSYRPGLAVTRKGDGQSLDPRDFPQPAP